MKLYQIVLRNITRKKKRMLFASQGVVIGVPTKIRRRLSVGSASRYHGPRNGEENSRSVTRALCTRSPTLVFSAHNTRFVVA